MYVCMYVCMYCIRVCERARPRLGWVGGEIGRKAIKAIVIVVMY